MEVVNQIFQYFAAPALAGFVGTTIAAFFAFRRERSMQSLAKKHDAYVKLLTLLETLLAQMHSHEENGHIFHQTSEVRKLTEQVGEIEINKAEVLAKIYSSPEVTFRLKEWIGARDRYWKELTKYNNPVEMSVAKLQAQHTHLARARATLRDVEARQEELLAAVRKDLGLESKKFAIRPKWLARLSKRR
jgi:septal ring factor EnvC (AmiA/AmiB activator)